MRSKYDLYSERLIPDTTDLNRIDPGYLFGIILPIPILTDSYQYFLIHTNTTDNSISEYQQVLVVSA